MRLGFELCLGSGGLLLERGLGCVQGGAFDWRFALWPGPTPLSPFEISSSVLEGPGQGVALPTSAFSREKLTPTGRTPPPGS